MVELQRFVYDYSSLLHFSHEMFCYDVNRALHDYLQPVFDAVSERTVALCSASTSR